METCMLQEVRQMGSNEANCLQSDRLIKTLIQYNKRNINLKGNGKHIRSNGSVYIQQSMTFECEDEMILAPEVDEISKTEGVNNNGKILQILNDYIHVIYTHNNDKQFECIVDKLGKCDINNCEIFKRNRNETNGYEQNVVTNIMDKIHCYFQHCFDIGNRLRIHDKQEIYQYVEQNGIDAENLCDKHLFDRIHQKLSEQRSTNNINRQHNLHKKYNQLKLEGVDIEDNNMNKYSFGNKFEYGYIGEHRDDGFIVIAKYKDLKEELITNNINTISSNQFNHELLKAMVHFDSDFCRNTFKQYTDCYYDVEWIFSVEHVLAFMIYCNYTSLQYTFSKTYRINNGKDHCNFYHLGKLLKISVKKFGTKLCRGRIKSFYHGISEQLIFPQYIGDGEGLTGIQIHCPLSTTSSFEIATQFTNNNGLIIEFGGDECFAKYFSMEWLSDYGNELEYFFIQNNVIGETLEIINIIDGKFGWNYDAILMALKYIRMITTNSIKYDKENISGKMKELIVEIIEFRLNLNDNNNDKDNLCETLTEYGKQLILTYFMNQKQIWLDYENMKNSFLFHLFFFVDNDIELKWINMEHTNIVFPNIEHLNITGIKLCDQIIHFIFNYLNEMQIKNATKINRICILPQQYDYNFNIKKYENKFNEIGFKMEESKQYECKCIDRNQLLRIDKIFPKDIICDIITNKYNLPNDLSTILLQFCGLSELTRECEFGNKYSNLCMIPPCNKCCNC